VSASGRVLVVDVGTSSVRAAVVDADGTTAAGRERELLPDSPADGLVEFDATLMADTCLDLARAALDAGGPVEAVGVSNQRGSTIVWDRATGVPMGPALGWQDLRAIRLGAMDPKGQNLTEIAFWIGALGVFTSLAMDATVLFFVIYFLMELF